MNGINSLNRIIYQQDWKKQQQIVQSITAATPNNKDKERGNNYGKKEKSKRKVNNYGGGARVR